MLGELFRAQKLADKEVGALVTLDLIYEIQHTALDSDTQSSMSRVMNECAAEPGDLKIRAAKVVSLLELIQETEPTTAELVAQCLFDTLDRGNQVAEVTEALEWLLAHNLLGYSEKLGYKIQSTAGEEWERTKREIPVKREDISEQVQAALKYLIEDTKEKPKHKERAFPIGGVYSDSASKRDEKIVDPKDDASIQVDFRFLPRDQTDEATWRDRSKESLLEERLIWVCGDLSDIDDRVRQLVRCRSMIGKFGKKRGSLTQAKQLLLGQEEVRLGDLQSEVRDAVASAWRSGNFYFQGECYPASEFNAFGTALTKTATNILATLFPHFDPINITPGELAQLTESELNGPSVKFTEDHLGILEQDSGRFVPSCTGVVPRRIQEHIENEDGISGVNLLQHFGRPPYGYRPEVVKACVAGLLRGSKIKIQSVEAGGEITAIRDAGVADLFSSDRIFKRSEIYPVGDDDVGYQARAKICRFLAEQLKVTIDREDHLIADEVAKLFPQQAIRLREVMGTRRIRKSEEAISEMRILEHGIWSVLPERCFALELRTSGTQELDFRLHAPDSDESRNEFLHTRSSEALQIVRSEILSRRSPRKPLSNLHLIDAGLWTTIPKQCWQLEREITRIQDEHAFTLSDSDSDAARAAFVSSQSADAMKIVTDDINTRPLTKRKPLPEYPIAEAGLWANCAAECYDLEIEVIKKQKTPFQLIDPDHESARSKFEQANPEKASERKKLIEKYCPPELPGMDSDPEPKKRKRKAGKTGGAAK
ncbi:hypothetical protein Poly21_44340 [Allorhodopirellula heiligendammensis]|uniref:Uncharacterized protein n=1 Tax=Allorhodopirellula heiligendammensis TaxID=2714739 RepID=A0A5C6BGZ1_9BACT|nr:hypothetical protein Poly21_44340 [Allorhodopirellula heiligendammensis]